MKRIIKTIAAILLVLPMLAGFFPARRAEGAEGFVSMPRSLADDIITQRALRLAFLGSPEGLNTWTPRYSFRACNSTKHYDAGVPENSMPYSRSALFNGTEFTGKQQYVGWVDPDTGATPDYAFTITNFLRQANEPGSLFDRAASEAYLRDANWGALLGSDCSAFLSYAWQIPHMTTYMFTSDAVDQNICRIVPATRGHEGIYTAEDLIALEPGDAMIAANRSGTDEHGNPLYRGHCVIITDIKLDGAGRPAIVETVEEIAPRAVSKTRTAQEFLEFANKFHSSGSYFRFYRLISKRHLKLEIELTLDVCGGEPLPAGADVLPVFAKDISGALTYAPLLSVLPQRTGYRFLGWSLTPAGEVLAADTPILTQRDHTVYAVWAEG